MNAQNFYLCLFLWSTLLASQVPICFFRTSRLELVFAHWNLIWSMFCYSSLNVHFASSLRWKRYGFVFDLPCPFSTVVNFCLSFILELSLSWNVRIYSLFAEATWLLFHSLASYYGVFLESRWRRSSCLQIVPLLMLDFRHLIAKYSAWALTQKNVIFHSLLSRLSTRFLISLRGMNDLCFA